MENNELLNECLGKLDQLRYRRNGDIDSVDADYILELADILGRVIVGLLKERGAANAK